MLRLVSYILLMVTLNSVSHAGELQTREEIKNVGRSLFTVGDYSGLNDLGTKYLENSERTSSGLWKLTLYYVGLSGIPNTKVSEPEYWESLKSKADAWKKVNKDLSFADMFYVDILINEAWMYRGSGWGNTVRKEDWKLFYAKIQEAQVYLEENESLKTVDPRWYEKMIVIAQLQGWEMEQFYTLLDEALDTHPQFYEIYFRAFNYLQPRWHGSLEEIEKFADYAVTKSYATEKNGMYARFYWYASQAEYGHSLFTKSHVRWDKMKKGIDDVIS